MKIAFITCWSNLKIYSIQASHVKQALEKIINSRIDIVTSNCGCFYPNFKSVFTEDYKRQLTDINASYINVPYTRCKRKSNPIHLIKYLYKGVSEVLRGYLFSRDTKNYEIVHFHQSCDSFGIESLKWFLRFAKKRKKIITIYGFSSIEKGNYGLGHIYNAADAVIVSTHYMKNKLLECGVNQSKIHVIPYGATIKKIESESRSGIIMFSGSPLMNVKGFTYVAGALKRLKDKGYPITLKMHGFYVQGDKEWAIEIARKEGISDLINWITINSEDELINAYQQSLYCLIPYTDYPGCFPATIAMANATPLIVSDAMGLSEYVDGTGIVVQARSVNELADAMLKLLLEDKVRIEMGIRGRVVAEKLYSWDALAQQTFNIYKMPGK